MMLKIPLENIISKIKESTKLSDSEINNKVETKIKELSGLVSKEGAAHIVANDLGVKLFESMSSGRLQIKNIVAGLRNVTFLARVLNIYPVREYNSKGKTGKVVSMLVGDETGKMRLVFWDMKHINMVEKGELKEGDLVRIRNGYVRESRLAGGLEVHTSGTSFVEINPEDAESKKIPETKVAKETATRVKISGIEEGVFEIRGAIVHVFEGNLFFEVCPECNKKARDSICAEHGAVTPKHSLMLSVIVDDGSSNIRVVFFGTRAQQILGMGAEEAYKLAQEKNSNFYPVQMKMKDIMGKEIIVDGKVGKNNFSGDLEMIARSVGFPNPIKEARMLVG